MKRSGGVLSAMVVDPEHPSYLEKEAERRLVLQTLDALSEPDAENMLGKIELVIIEGGAPGADRCAQDWAVVNWAKLETYEADWNNIDRPGAVIRKRKDGTLYDAAAGFIRNQRALDEGKPDLLLAFPGNRGTYDMMGRARKAGIEVRKVGW